MNLTNTDLIVRLQLLGCKYSELTNLFVNNLKYGKDCIEKNQTDLLLLNSYIELLESYRNLDMKGLIWRDYNLAPINTQVQFFTNDVAMSSNIVLSGVTVEEQLIEITQSINNYSTDYFSYYMLASSKREMDTLFINTPCSNPNITVLLNGITKVNLKYSKYGKCSPYNNCINEEQLQEILDKVSKLTNLCFQPIGFNYKESK